MKRKIICALTLMALCLTALPSFAEEADNGARDNPYRLARPALSKPRCFPTARRAAAPAKRTMKPCPWR